MRCFDFCVFDLYTYFILFRSRFTFLPDLKDFILTLPSDVHEATLSPMMFGLQSAIRTIGHDSVMTQVQVHGNTRFSGNTITADPDIHIRIASLVESPPFATPTSLWVTECAFSQTDQQVMTKLSSYITDCPGLVAVMKIVIKEVPTFASPREDSTIANAFRTRRTVTSPAQWMPRRTPDIFFGPVSAHGHNWIHIQSIKVHVWVRTSDAPIDLSNRNPGVYAHGVSCELALVLYVFVNSLT